VRSVSITTKVVSLNYYQGEVYSIQNDVTAYYDITEILLKVVLNTKTLTYTNSLISPISILYAK
jgi:hypothetical protein